MILRRLHPLRLLLAAIGSGGRLPLISREQHGKGREIGRPSWQPFDQSDKSQCWQRCSSGTISVTIHPYRIFYCRRHHRLAVAGPAITDPLASQQNFQLMDHSSQFYFLTLRKHACRLRYIIYQMHRGEMSSKDLIDNLEYAASILESTYVDSCRLQVEEQIDQIDSEDVPEEVRKWLALTFTQSVNEQHQKVSFKSVANAIRSGIRFDRLARRSMSSGLDIVPDNVAELLKNINDWNFDVFLLNELSENNALKCVSMALFSKYNFLNKYKIPMVKFEAFLNKLQQGYSKHNNPYHNLVHAADVTQTAHWLLAQSGLVECLTDLELFAYLFAAMVHDFEHTGHTNNYHVQSSSDYALIYNDRSVLENHHVSAIFRLMHDSSQYNILEKLTKEEIRQFRNLVIEIVLCTDMSTHFAQVKDVKQMITSDEEIDKTKALSFLIHCSDISHPAKIWPFHFRWTEQLMEEFFRQGDLEMAMGNPISPLCDRLTVNIADSQIAFIDFIVEPTMIICSELLAKLLEPVLQAFDSGSGERPKQLNSIDDFRMSQPWMKIIPENRMKWKEYIAQQNKLPE
ncbi:putative 3',5'-cyclic phosphodiesterase pde-1 [Trichinella spiralis]|uniref:Phosphodiesterase n=1 Tax=Trichinella spiralis TaxID=6334 RepID=A0A0V1AZN2_TRISP|nr:putative 3',5'-cyclic phosphodiesterase pde-1 [Trichinella spiralis]